MKYKKILLFVIFILIIAIPISYANTNVSDEIGINNENEPVLMKNSNEYYFNSSLPNDGDGSKENPYNYLDSSRIQADSTLYFTDGNYELNTNKNIFNVKIVGQNSEKTIINLKKHTLTTYNFIAENVTLFNGHIQNYYELNLTNVILDYCEGTSMDSYSNTYGGAICNIGDTIENPTVNINKCTFKENIAKYGGAIYSIAGTVNIEDSVFFHNSADNYGGAIACEYNYGLNIKNTIFEHCYSLKNAGGAIYLREAKTNISNSTFRYNKATFGGAICDLENSIEITNSTFNSNTADYSGGAIYKMYGNITIHTSDFTENNAKNGGGLLIDNSTLILINNEIYDNIAEMGEDLYTILNIKEVLNENIINDHYNLGKLNINFESYNYTIYKYKPNIIETLPEYYNLADDGFLTPVKNQQNSGNCWAFAQLAALESCILKSSGESLDLSEENMKNLIAKFSDYGWNVYTNEGGLDQMGLGYLTSWLGPVLEENDEFDDFSVLSPVLDSIMHVQDVIFLKRNNALDNNAIKEAILKYGGVATGIFYESENLKYSTAGYYYGGKELANHAVTIVGWNDTYSSNNFLKKPAGDGAWIVKNSWGKSWGDKGYCYVSYYDTKLAEIGKDFYSYTFILDDKEKFNKNYQYDIAGMTDFFNTGKTSVWYQNIFTSEGYETLKAFSTYFNTTTDYEAYVYVNNELKSVQVGTSPGGYHTIKFTPFVNLMPEDEFKISIKIKSPISASFPVSEGLITNKKIYTPNISFFSYDGKKWYDLSNYTHTYGTHTYTSQVACIKAFTSYSNLNFTISNVSAKTGEPVNITAEIYGENGDIINSGKIIFDINNEKYPINVTGSKAVLSLTFEDAGIYNITGYFTSNNIYQYATANITELLLNLSIDDYTYSNNMTINIISNVVGNATITINNKTYPVKLNNNSTITIEEQLLPGKYNATLKYKDITKQTTFEIYKINTQITAQNQTITNTNQLKINTTLQDENKNTLNKTLKIQNNTIKTGNNTITITFEGDEIYNPTNTTINIYLQYIDQIIIKNEKYPHNISVNITSNIADNATITINNKTYSVTIKNNNTITINEQLLPGKYNATLKYKDITKQTTFEIYKINTQITAQNQTITNINKLKINATLQDENKNTLNKTLKIQNNTIKPGNNTITITFEGDEIYHPTNTTINIELKNYIDFAASYDNQIILNITSNINDTINITINNKSYLFKIENNETLMIQDKLNPGNYNITLKWDKITLSKMLTVNKIKTQIKTNNFEMYYKDGSKAIISLTDENNNILANKNIIFNINGVEYTRTTDSDGIARITVNLNSGEYEIRTSYAGDEKYEKSSNYISVKIKPTLIANNLTKFYRNQSQFFVKLIDNTGNIIANKEILFNINGVYYTRQTNSSGIAKLNINLNAGEYIITTLNEETGEMISNKISVLSLLQENYDLVKYYKNDSQYLLKVYNKNGSIAVGVKVTFNINGVYYTRQTNSSGIAKLNINLAPGNYIITAEYENCKVSNHISVKDILYAEDMEMKYRDGSKFNVKLVDGKGNPFAKESITFNINGVFYTRITNDNGIASLNINLMSGKYIITSSYNGLNIANKITVY